MGKAHRKLSFRIGLALIDVRKLLVVCRIVIGRGALDAVLQHIVVLVRSGQTAKCVVVSGFVQIRNIFDEVSGFQRLQRLVGQVLGVRPGVSLGGVILVREVRPLVLLLTCFGDFSHL